MRFPRERQVWGTSDIEIIYPRFPAGWISRKSGIQPWPGWSCAAPRMGIEDFSHPLDLMLMDPTENSSQISIREGNSISLIPRMALSPLEFLGFSTQIPQFHSLIPESRGFPSPLPAAIPAIPREKNPSPPRNPQNSQFFQIIFPFPNITQRIFPFPSASAKGGAGAAGRFPPSSLFRGKPGSCRSQESSRLSLRGRNLGHRASLSRGSGIQGLGFTLD